MEKMDKKKKRRKIRLIKSLVLVVAFVVAIGATFGITMAYFGGTSTTEKAEMTLKTGLWVNAKDITTVSASQYVVPSQVINPTCEVSIKSSKEKGNAANTGESASKALLRALIVFTDETGSLSNTTSAGYFEVKSGSTHVGNFVKDGETNYYYFMPTSVTSITGSETMQVIDTTAGEVTYKFTLNVAVPKELGNSAGGSKITLEVSYQVIQADFFNDAGAEITKTVTNAKEIFGHASVSGDASYA